MTATEHAFILLTQVCGVSPEELISAFDTTVDYRKISIPKKNGSTRTLHEPAAPLKHVQRKLLGWLTKLVRRGNFYAKHTGNEIFHLVRYIDTDIEIVSPVNQQLHGCIPRRSIVGAARKLLETDGRFIIARDLNNAFPSVTNELVYEYFLELFTVEIQLYMDIYERAQGKHRFRGFYPYHYLRYTLFPNSKCYAFRHLIRQIRQGTTGHQVALIVDALARQITELVTYNNGLPQGAPSSGFLLALILSRKSVLGDILDTSVASGYVDDFFFKTESRDHAKNYHISTGYDCLYFKQEKNRYYDLKHGAAKILGLHIARTKITEEERKSSLQVLDTWEFRSKAASGEIPAGFQRAIRSGRGWYITHVTLPKKIQKKIRAILYQATEDQVTDFTYQRALGYHGMAVQVYGYSLEGYPSSIKKTVENFRKKYQLLFDLKTTRS